MKDVHALLLEIYAVIFGSSFSISQENVLWAEYYVKSLYAFYSWLIIAIGLTIKGWFTK